jgi:uncharacterized protein (DUF885 family)
MRARIALAALLLLTTSAFAQTAADLDQRRKALSDLVNEVWEWRLEQSPELASNVGDNRHNDRWSDESVAALDAEAKKHRQFLARANAISTTGFAEQEALNKTVLVRQLENALESYRLKDYEMPVNQLQGAYLQVPQMIASLQFKTAKDYTDWIARMHGVPRLLDQVAERMRLGMRDHLMPPRFILEKTAAQIEAIAAQAPEDTPFVKPLTKIPPELRTALLAAVRDDVLPAYAKFAKFVRNDYAPHGREDVGIWALPNGRERYAIAVKRTTTTNLTPDEIHQLGLREVARDEEEMQAIAKRLGFESLAALREAVEKKPELKATSREQILDLYRKDIEQMNEKLPALFGNLPKQKCEVRSVEAFREKSAPGGQYMRGTKDGSRPGAVVINTSEPEKRSLMMIEAVAYHEGVPGHHLQNAVAQQLPELPPFRQQGGGFTAFGEGWALYAERLGKEVGFYSDPYSDYGRLQSDILRAIRLVVDTGLHSKKWTRQQVVDYFHAHSSADEPTVQIETDRYIAWPSQALGYKVGQLEILRLRAKAEKELGPKFDIRQFHDVVIGAGSIPLDVLAQRVDAWINSVK